MSYNYKYLSNTIYTVLVIFYLVILIITLGILKLKRWSIKNEIEEKISILIH